VDKCVLVYGISRGESRMDAWRGRHRCRRLGAGKHDANELCFSSILRASTSFSGRCTLRFFGTDGGTICVEASRVRAGLAPPEITCK
jgi:hypothetical protein